MFSVDTLYLIVRHFKKNVSQVRTILLKESALIAPRIVKGNICCTLSLLNMFLQD